MATKKKMLQAAAGVGGEPEGAWDLSYAYYDDPLLWDVSSSYFKVSFSVATQETAPRGIFFKPDGLKMYIVGSSGDEVNEYSLSTAWLVTTSSYVRTFSVSAQTPVPTDLFFKPDGTKMYVIGSNFDAVYEYDLSTAWNISTASFLQSFSVTTQETTPEAIFFKPDGTKMYIAGSNGDDVNEYDLSTAWDVSSAVFLQLFSVAAYANSPQGLSFKPDGTKMYIAQLSGTYEGVIEYDLSTAWDVSSASYSKNFVTTANITSPTGLFLNPDGTGFYITDYSTDLVYQYSLGGFSVSAQDVSSWGISFKPDGTKMYFVGDSFPDSVYEYDLSSAWDTSTASFLQSFSVYSQETRAAGLFFKPDGTKMYVSGYTGDDVNEYDLSTAWDVSTAVFSQNFSVSDTLVFGVFFKPDGTKMYVAGQGNDNIYEYDLSTAWDVSTASFLQSFSVLAQEPGVANLSFKPDGTKMYIAGYGGGAEVNEYDLSTAWDISTASHLQDFSVSAQAGFATGIFFKPEGEKMFISDTGSDRVFTYSLGVQE